MSTTTASNQDFSKYDQVRKAHTYRLAEHEGDRYDEDYRITTLDLGAYLRGDARDKARFADAFAGALEEIGFAVLTGHGVSPALYDDVHAGTAELFEGTPLADKMRFRAARFGSVSQGYFPIEETSDIHPDLVEGWVWCRRAFDMPQTRTAPFDAGTYWPQAAFEPRFRKLALAHEALFKPIAQAMFQGLGVDPHIYDRKLTGTNFGMRLNYYPAMTELQAASGAGRLLGHEDVDLFTILPATKVDGLQVWNHRTNAWVRLRAPAGSIIINTGDYMQRITNDRLPSTTHRVGKPTDGSHVTSARLVPDRGLCVGGRDARGAAGLGRAPLRADQGDYVPHAKHEQVLRRRLRGGVIFLGPPASSRLFLSAYTASTRQGSKSRLEAGGPRKASASPPGRGCRLARTARRRRWLG